MRGLSIFSISSLASLLRRLPFLVQICVYDCCVAYVRIRVCVYVFVLYEELADCTAASATMFGAGLCVCEHTNTSIYIHMGPRLSNLHPSSHGGDQTWNIWISRSVNFLDRSFQWWGLRLFKWRICWIFGESCKILFNMYGDSRENLLQILAVVIILYISIQAFLFWLNHHHQHYNCAKGKMYPYRTHACIYTPLCISVYIYTNNIHLCRHFHIYTSMYIHIHLH